MNIMFFQTHAIGVETMRFRNLATNLSAIVTILFAIIAMNGVCGGRSFGDDAREKAAHRQRRVIFNNDGDDAWYAGAPLTKEGFLSMRLDHIGDCGVDSMFYCTTMSINSFTHDSQITEVFTTKSGLASNNRMSELIKVQTDPLKLAIETCRQHDIEIIWTLRMNDVHDSFVPQFLSQWKKDHPQLLMGTPEQAEETDVRHPLHFWSWADFERQEVRDVILVAVKDVLDRYDVDGIDLDFQRHICYFKETRRYEPVTAEHCEMLTNLVGKIRKEVLAASEQKGKPILLSTRILATLEQNRRFGLDVEKWADNGYLDFITTGCGYDPFTMPDDMIRRGHAWGLPVYRCFSGSAMLQEEVQHSDLLPQNLAAWRAAAANAWYDGVDGIMSFNLFPKLPGTPQTETARTAWREMGDPKGLVGKDKLYCIEHLHYDDYCYLFKSVPREGRLPVTIFKGATVTRNLPVADDIPGLANRIEKLRLRVCLAGFEAGDKINVKMNGAELALAPEKPSWVVGDVPPEVMKQGKNKLAVVFTSGKADSLVMQSVELTVDYK
jgi:hypothetical protein